MKGKNEDITTLGHAYKHVYTSKIHVMINLQNEVISNRVMIFVPKYPH